MPTKPLKLCKSPGCKNLTSASYCPQHSSPIPHLCNVRGCKNLTAERYCKEHQQELEQKQIEQDKKEQRYKNYSRDWKNLSKMIRAREPFCRMCMIKNLYTLSQCVDHIDGNPNNNNEDNLQALCWSCHSSKTLADRNRKHTTKGEGV